MGRDVIFVLGRPGSGKDTQCVKIAQHFGFVHLSAGELLRKEKQKQDSEYRKVIEEHFREFKMAPVEITCALLENEMNGSNSDNFLIDGFPPNLSNLDWWNEQMGEKAKIKFVLVLDAPEDLCVRRCVRRGQEGSGRVEDNSESLKIRMALFNKDTVPVIDHFARVNLVRKVDASKEEDEVFEQIKEHFK